MNFFFQTNLSVDWDGAFQDYICLKPRNRFFPNASIHSKIEFENIPKLYMVRSLFEFNTFYVNVINIIVFFRHHIFVCRCQLNTNQIYQHCKC